jgi:PilZ domain
MNKQIKEKRREPRVVHKAVVIIAYGEGENLAFEDAELVDCSPNGVALLFHRPLSVGHHFLLKLKLNQMLLVRYVVRNCQRSGRKLFRVGGELAGHVGGAEEIEPDVIVNALLAG